MNATTAISEDTTGRGMVVVEKISKSFSDGSRRSRPLKDVTFTAEPGSFIAIMGRSGSGKSTLLSILGSLEHPDAGSFLLDGINITQASKREQTKLRMKDIGFVFQSYNLFPTLTALQNVMIPLEFSHCPMAKRKSRALSLLADVGIDEERRHRKANRLSGGEQQRVGIARALANEPRLLLADEPTGSLDEDNAKDILSLLQTTSQQRGTTVIVVTHDRSVARRADRVYRLRNGALHEE